jgi:hypothetical protein
MSGPKRTPLASRTPKTNVTPEILQRWREGCAILREMSTTEYWERKSERWRRFQQIDKTFWPIVDPGGPSVFDPELDGPCTWGLPADWQIAQNWRKALIAASGETPRNFGPHPRPTRRRS